MRILVPVVFAVLLFADSASACSCLPRKAPCEAFERAPAIFIAVVTDIDPASERNARPAVHLSVEQSFKGISQTTVKMFQGTSGGDCSFEFQKGERYLLYASYSEETGTYHTNICTRSRPLAYAGEDLAYLRGSPPADSAPSLTGTVVKQDFKEEARPSETELIRGVKVTAEGQNGQKFEAFTDDDGTYNITGLPPGTYKVHADLPPYLSLASDPPDTVEVASKGCVSVVFHARTDGRISGVVRDAKGKVAPQVDVDLIPFELANRLGDRGIGRVKTTTKDGNYEFRDLQPGRYLLDINIRSNPEGDNPFPRMFFPGVANAANATVITLGKGEKLSGYDISLPHPLPVSIIKGVLVWQDGKPVVQALVELKNTPENVSGGSLNSANVDQKGHFELKAIEGTEAWVHASTMIRTESGLDVMIAEPVRVVAGSQPRRIKLVITKKAKGGVRIIR